MNTLEDLRRSLDGRATRTSDGHGLVQAAQEGAARIRRRRRIAGAAATACLVLAAAAVVPVVVARQRADHPPVVAASAPYRLPGQVTLEVTGSKYFPIQQSTDGNVQQLAVRNRDTTVIGDNGGDVVAYDPGTFDPTALRRGTRTSVNGHDAWLVPDYQLPDVDPAQPVLGWQDPSGVWVLAFLMGRLPGPVAALTAFTAAIRIGPPRPLATPFRLASMPGGLPLSAVIDSGGPNGFTSVRVAFGTHQSPVLIPFPRLPQVAPLKIDAGPDDPDMPMIKDGLTRIAPIAGHPAWYGDGTGELGAPVGGGHLLIDAGNCTVQFISADRTRIGRDDLTAMAATATYADCTDPSTWTSPLSR